MMRLSQIERAGIMTFHRKAAAFEKAKEKLSGGALSRSPNPADPNAMSPGVEAAVKNAVQAELKRHRCARPRSGRSAGRRGRRQEGRSRQVQSCVSGDAPGLPRHGMGALLLVSSRAGSTLSSLSRSAMHSLAPRGPLHGHTPVLPFP